MEWKRSQLKTPQRGVKTFPGVFPGG